jgi:hypothetical protein
MLSSLALTLAAASAAGGINGINGGMPNRISMNVTVPKQTQGATFGEKVNAGLHAAGSAVASGASLVVECGAAACALALPDGTGYLADLQALTLAPLDPAQGAALRKGSGGASLLGGAVPGGSVVSAAVSSVGSLGGGSGAAAASYAATGRAAAPSAPATLTNRARDDGGIDVVEPLVDGDYVVTLDVARPAVAPVRAAKVPASAAPASTRIRIRLVISAADGTLRVRRDSPANSVALQNGGG